jgi:murein DD-endopeptidase MepM/ murein hydrolase activator NlpD
MGHTMNCVKSTAGLACFFLWVGLTSPTHAQRLYKYQDANGMWVYSDRQPEDGQQYQEETLLRSSDTPEVRVFQRPTADGLSLFADNTYYSPVQIAYQLASMENLAPDTPETGDMVLPARSETELLFITRGDVTLPMSFEYQFQYIPGDPAARHEPQELYRLPYASAESFHVSQAYPDQATHADPTSLYAIDFQMPVGSGVYAARGGIVIEVASDFYQSGTDRDIDGPRANFVRVHHDDGTMSLYAHLNWNSIRVIPGQRVERGEYLAASGNTGFSTGPHLHFTVQRNQEGAIVSIPIQFAGIDGRAVTLHAGDQPTAY